MSEVISMRSEELSESQEKLLWDLIQQLKEIRTICRPFTNIPGENQDVIKECNTFISMLRESWDMSMFWNKKLQMNIFDTLWLQAFPEVSRILTTWMLDLAAELWEKSELDKNVQWAIATVAAAVQAWVEIDREGNKYWKDLEKFWSKLYWDNLNWKDWIWDTEIIQEDGYLVIYFQDSPKAYLPRNLQQEYQWKSWKILMDDCKLENRLVTFNDFWYVLNWLSKLWINDSKIQADFFREVLGLEKGIYLCRDLQMGGEECNAFDISETWIEFIAVWVDSQKSEYRALTS